MKRPVLATVVAATALALSACGTEASDAPAAADGTAVAEPSLEVAAAFYPLELAVSRIGGERVALTGLTRPGVDPHAAELTPREVGRLAEADLVVLLSGFQPAVDDAVKSVAADAALDVAPYADLSLALTHDGDEHGGESEAEHADHGGTDPHFWLDPTRYASVAEAIAVRLGELDPEGAETYAANAAQLAAELAALDEDFAAGLATCAHRDLVTAHAAFGYLADRYDLHQRGISGLTPESEPSAAQVRDLVEHVRESGVSTIYAETLLSPALAETIAREAGVRVEVLDPIEGVTEASAGSDYFQIMAVNLQTLRTGQECS